MFQRRLLLDVLQYQGSEKTLDIEELLTPSHPLTGCRIFCPLDHLCQGAEEDNGDVETAWVRGFHQTGQALERSGPILSTVEEGIPPQAEGDTSTSMRSHLPFTGSSR